jgi:hypothetical protein
VLFTGTFVLGVCFFAPPPFSGIGSVFHQLLLLSMGYDSLLLVFQFCGAVRFRMLLTGSGDELCDPLPALIQRVAYRLPALGLPAFPAFVY